MKKFTIILWLSILFSGIGIFFWYNDWKFSLPTPVPPNYMPVALSETIDLNNKITTTASQSLFLHFFNPHCPCSRFNMAHFKSLVEKFGNDIKFAIVVLSAGEYTEKEIQNKFKLTIPVFFDTSIAISCGVYSTPQAVIIDKDKKLFYRGNYNRTRYCPDKKTEYARLALESFLTNNNSVSFNQLALKAYGCQIPKCIK